MMARLANLLMLLSSMPPTPTRSLRVVPRNNPHRSRIHDQHVPRGSWAALGNVAAGHGVEDVTAAALAPPSPPFPVAAKKTEEALPPGGTTTILQRSSRHVVAYKPSGVVCHHSGWAGSRSKHKRGEVPEVPMLQRVRDALHDVERTTAGTLAEEGREVDGGGDDDIIPMRRVNLIHRLDRGASGALLFAYADDDVGGDSELDDGKGGEKSKGITAELIDAMRRPDSTKTYVALVRGSGELRGEDLRTKGWFEVDRPIRDDDGVLREASTSFKFVAGQTETSFDRPRVALVLARPRQGRWHQIRRHLNGLSHPIIGDSTHGVSKINREWRDGRNVPYERVLLHLGRIEITTTDNFPDGIDVAAPMPRDMLDALRTYAPEVLEQSLPLLKEMGIPIDPIDDSGDSRYEAGRWSIPDALLPRSGDDGDGIDADVLEEGLHYVVVSKPPVVVVHNSRWSQSMREGMPMLQRVRDKTGRRVNPVHRLDRGASGCLLFSFAKIREGKDDGAGCDVTRSLMESMQLPGTQKTYIALCDGNGSWNGVNLLERGWFTFTNPVRDEWDKTIEDATTEFRFVASSILPPVDDDADDDGNMEGRMVSIVLARPKTGRWHQIRQHLASGTIGHAILGDSSHGRSRTNRIWKKKRHLMKERVCLHLSRLYMPPTEYAPDGIDVTCPLALDLAKMLEMMPMELLDAARRILAEEGIHVKEINTVRF